MANPSNPLDAPVEVTLVANTSVGLHDGPTELAALGKAPDVSGTLPKVDIDRKGTANVGKDGPINTGASPQDLINYGVFGTKGSIANLDLTHPDVLRSAQDKINCVSVRTADAADDKAANFVVGKDGTVTVVNNPDNTKNPQLNIFLDKDSAGESKAQQKAADSLLTYLESHYGFKGSIVDDPNHLVLDSVKTASTPNDTFSPAQRAAMAAAWGTQTGELPAGPPPPPPGVAPGTEIPSGIMPPGPMGMRMPVPGMPGASGGYPREAGPISGYPQVRYPQPGYPQGEYPQTLNPHRPFHWGRPIFNSETSGGGFINTETAFSFSGNLLAAWLRDQGFDPDSPETPHKLEALAKTNPMLAAELSKAFATISQLKAQDRGKPISPGSIPSDLAQKIAHDEVAKFSKDPAILGADGKTPDPGKLALALQLGKVPTSEDLKNPAYLQLMENARGQNPNQALLRAAQASIGQPMWEGTGAPANLGCAVTVSKWCQEAGYKDIFAENTVDLERQVRSHGAVEVSSADAKPGDMVFFDPNGHGHGHVAVYAGGNEALANSSRAGVVEKNTIASMDEGRQIHFYRLPPRNTDTEIATTGTSKAAA